MFRNDQWTLHKMASQRYQLKFCDQLDEIITTRNITNTPTFIPSSNKILTIPTPIPELAPVTKATLSFNSVISNSILVGDSRNSSTRGRGRRMNSRRTDVLEILNEWSYRIFDACLVD